MKLYLRSAGLAVLIAVAAAQMIQPDTSKQTADPERSLWKDRRVDPRVADILRRACANCHSYETKWPWYARISPVSWWLARHVNQGRAKLNFDDWSSAAATDQLEEMYDSIAKKKMPLASYLLMHPEARLSQADRDTLLAWTDGKPDHGSR